MTTTTLVRSFLVAAVVAGLAGARPTIAVAEPVAAHALVGARVGGIAPLDGLSPFASFGLEVGAVLPPLHRRLAIVIAADYTQPTATGSAMDPRVAGGTFTWKLTERELGLMAVIMYRATQVKRVTPYAGIGPRALFLESTVGDDGLPVISDTTEVSTKVGVGVPLGAELRLGPGRLTAELLLQYGALDHVATGDSHTGAVSLAVGYRLLL